MISNKPQAIPQTPGVYFFKNPAGEVIYIGKAGNLKNRLSSYFNKQSKDPKTKIMLEEAASVDWQELDSEIEALIVESEQIKLHEPKFNIAMRDGRSYSYVAFTDDLFPAVFVTHQSQIDTGDQSPTASFIGPFTDATALRTTLAHLRRIFRFCTCLNKHNRFCLNYHIGKCKGYCCLKNPTVSDEQINDYKQDIKAVKDLLSGRRIKAIGDLKKEMTAAADEENFEKAIEIKDKIEKINAVFENAKVIREMSKKTDALRQIKLALNLTGEPRRIEGYDISNIQGRHATGSMVVFTDGNPNKDEYKKFRIKFTPRGGDTAMLQEVLKRRFKHPEWQFPDLVIIDGGKAQLNAARAIIKTGIPILSLTKNDKHIGDHIFISGKKKSIMLKRLPEIVKNLILSVDSEAHRFAIGYYRKLHRISI